MLLPERWRWEAKLYSPASIEQLRTSNAGEGDLGVEPEWIAFWSAEDVLTSNIAYSIAESLPGFFGFATTGGGEPLAFDVRGGEPYSIVMVPFVPMEIGSAIRIAQSFDELREQLGKNRSLDNLPLQPTRGAGESD